MEAVIYTVIGKNYGTFTDKDDGRVVTYASLFVSAPFVSNRDNPNYHFEGEKAFTFKCISREVFDDVAPGEKVQLYFDLKGKVNLVASV